MLICWLLISASVMLRKLREPSVRWERFPRLSPSPIFSGRRVPAAAAAFFIGVWATHEIISHQEEKDPSLVVIDEFAGQMLTFVFAGQLLYHNTDAWLVYLIGFGLFRLFDIVKLFPVKWADSRLKNAWGVMLDDIFAGIIAGAFLIGFIRLIH